MRLQELQRAFQARVLALQSGIEPELNGQAEPDFEQRLDTYVGGYRSRLVEALGATYPVLQKVMGEEEFARQIRAYIELTPSQHFSVREYGGQVARRLLDMDYRGQGRWFAELAGWEWTLADVFDAPDDDALEVNALATVPPDAWPEMTFDLRASVRRRQTSTNIVEWWRAANGLCPQPVGRTDATSGQWVLWRRGVKTLFRSLDPLEADLLDAAGAGVTFGGLCELMAQRVDESEAAFRAASLLRGWIADELLSDRAASIRP
jgi:Putative DNA-binding domain